MKTVKFSTLGCKVNQYETQSIREQFHRAGFKELENRAPADICVINTCTVTHRADSDSSNIIRRAVRENPKAKIIVTGCLAECNGGRIKQLGRNISVVRNRDKDNIIRGLVHSPEFRVHSGITGFSGHTRAFLKIQDGCDNFCSYCIVPFVRGKPRSKKLKDILQEAERLVGNGFKEIVLSGICLGSYGKDLRPPINLIEVIKGLEQIDGLLRIRLSSIEAKDVTPELISLMANSPKLCRHLHIPIQSGDDAILRRMNRRYTAADYLNFIEYLRKKIPQIAITTDVLVGFPGETEKNFRNTAGLIRQILPLKVHIFPFSKRKGTAADGFSKQVGCDVIRKRIISLKKIAEEASFAYKRQFLKKKLNVLIEGPYRPNTNYLYGYSDNYIKAITAVKTDALNQLIPLEINRIEKDYVVGYFS